MSTRWSPTADSDLAFFRLQAAAEGLALALTVLALCVLLAMAFLAGERRRCEALRDTDPARAAQVCGPTDRSAR